MAAIAHLGVGLAAKRIAPSVPLVLLIVCAWAIDLVWAGFWLAGLEEMAKPNSPSPWSHGLVMAVFWALLAAGLAHLMRKKARLSVTIGLLVFSHWVVDFITQPMTHSFPGSVGPPLWWGGPTVGLGLYETALGQNLGEYGTFAAGVVVYVLALIKIRREKQAAKPSVAPGG